MRNRLPIPRTSFIGRQRASDELRALLPHTRLLTITGSGGSGKTRLALHVAQQGETALEDGLYWVDLAPLSDPALVPDTVARAIGLKAQPGRSPAELLLAHLRARAPLLVLDNCEHLRAACAALLDACFAASAGLRVLATSREPIGAAGEHVWPIPLLDVPAQSDSPEAVGAADSAALFVERARAVAPSFALGAHNSAAVAAICRRLEGLPLAIELAAARVTVLTPQQIADRLDDSIGLLSRAGPVSDARHSALRATIDWSHALLDTGAQRLFARLSLFVGGCTIDAVEHICAGDGLERADLLDLLSALHERSLLLVSQDIDTMRYRLLEPIRQYAAERLGVEPATWRRRHRDYYLALAEAAGLGLDGPEQLRWLDQLEREHENMRAALGWCAEARDTWAGLRLCRALTTFWVRREFAGEGQRWLQHFLHAAELEADPGLAAHALSASARLFTYVGDYPAARAQLERGLALARRSEDEATVADSLIEYGSACWELGDFGAARGALADGIALCRAGGWESTLSRGLIGLGLVQQFQGEYAAAQSTYEEGLALSRRLGHATAAAAILLNLATLALHGAHYERARRRYHEALELYRALGIRSGVADTLVNLAALAIDQDDDAAAEAACDEAEAIYRALDNQGDLGYVIVNRGDLALAAGQLAPARAHYEHALELFRAAGNQRLVGRCLGQLGALAVQEGRLAEAAERCAEALTLRRAIGHWPGVAFSLDGGLLDLAAAAGLHAVAARLLGAADAARLSLGRRRAPRAAQATAAIRQRLVARLGEGSFGALWDEGQAMGLEEAADYALASLSAAAVTQPRPELRIIALGPVRVYRGERLLTSADWSYAKARELVISLLCRQHASREQIGVELWPEASDEQVRQRFSAALAHARGALGREEGWIVLAEGRYSINRAIPLWFDVDAFEAALAEARRLLAAGSQDDRAARLLEEAIGLYQGDFAEDVADGAWLVPRREALRQAHLEALLALARLHGAAGRDEPALALYRRALAQDPYQEEAHHALIRAALRQGRRAQALAQYEALAAALAELGAAPDPAIAALVERARRGDHL